MDAELEKELREFLDKRRERAAFFKGMRDALLWILAVIGACAIIIWASLMAGGMAGVR